MSGRARTTKEILQAAEHEHDEEMARIDRNTRILSDLLRFVAEDFRSQLLIIAVTGTGFAALMKAFNDWKLGIPQQADAHRTGPSPGVGPFPTPTDDFWGWLLSGGMGGIFGGYIVNSAMGKVMKDFTPADNPYGFAHHLVSAAETTSDMAWALLFMSVLMGEGGLGGLVKGFTGGLEKAAGAL